MVPAIAVDGKVRTPGLHQIGDLVAGRFEECRSGGAKLRYLAYVGDRTARTELTELAPGTPLLRPHPSDSFVLIVTDHFRTNPLVISGGGGGPKTTAAGVLGDVLSLARE